MKVFTGLIKTMIGMLAIGIALSPMIFIMAYAAALGIKAAIGSVI